MSPNVIKIVQVPQKIWQKHSGLLLSWPLCSLPCCWRAAGRLVHVNRLWRLNNIKLSFDAAYSPWMMRLEDCSSTMAYWIRLMTVTIVGDSCSLMQIRGVMIDRETVWRRSPHSQQYVRLALPQIICRSPHMI